MTDAANVKLFRQWDQKSAAFIQQLRFIRISSSNPETFTLSRVGLHPSLKKHIDGPPPDTEMVDDDEAPLLLEPTSRFSSTIMTMDEVPM